MNDAAARQAVATALALPANLGPRLLRYLALFRPPNRSLTWERVARLLGELQGMIDAGRIQRHGRPWAVTPAAWQVALDEMLERRHSLSLPLKSHGYLLEILAGQANQAEARHEERVETERRQPRPDAGAGMQAVSARLSQAFPPPDPPPPGGTLAPSPLAGEGGDGGASPSRPQRPTRTPPPAEFRNLAAQLRGTFAAEPSPEPESHD